MSFIACTCIKVKNYISLNFFVASHKPKIVFVFSYITNGQWKIKLGLIWNGNWEYQNIAPVHFGEADYVHICSGPNHKIFESVWQLDFGINGYLHKLEVKHYNQLHFMPLPEMVSHGQPGEALLTPQK